MRRRAPTAALVAAIVLAACGGGGDEERTLEVYAASSLTEAFADLERSFEASHPGVDVRVTLAGSQVLRLQIEQGAPADVFASANERHMRALEEARLVRDSRVFAHNELVIIVPPDNPADIESLADLPDASRVVLGTANVPVGQYAREVLRLAAPHLGEGFEAMVLSRLVSEESNVRLARTKVELGEADAAIVYRTDAAASDRVRVVSIPREMNLIADYPIAVVRESEERELAEAWLDLVLSAEGRDILDRHGFIVE